MNWNIWVEIATRPECPAYADTKAADIPECICFYNYLQHLYF